MKRAIVVLAALAAACGGGSSSSAITAEEARDAMPSSAQASLATPGGATADPSQKLGAPGAGAAAAATHVAPYAAATIVLAVATNGSVAFWLDLVSDVVNGALPSSCSADTCTWGPGSGPWDLNVYRLVVTKQAERHYAWTLEGHPKSDATATFVTFVSGEAFTTGTRHVGHGTIRFDLDAASRLARIWNQPDDVGVLEAEYDNRTAATLTLRALGVKDATNPGGLVNAAYAFQGTSAGGDLEAAVKNLTTAAVWKLHSRWTETGAGRGDASYADGTHAVAQSECWDAAVTRFNLLYRGTTLDGATADPYGVDLGSASLCVFSAAAPPTLAAP